jgi:hypothetical protein
VEWLVCGLLILSGASLLWSGWRASQPEALVPGDAMALLTVRFGRHADGAVSK